MSAAQFPIYTSRGDWVAMLIGRYLYSPQGEWIGWIDAKALVFSVRGQHVGWLSRDFRVLRRRGGSNEERRSPPPAPPRVRLPMSVALPPMMSDLGYDTLDVFEEAAHLLDPADMDSVQDID
jgi:hypothetical protein